MEKVVDDDAKVQFNGDDINGIYEGNSVNDGYKDDNFDEDE